VSVGECISRLKGLDFAEVRLDTMDADPAAVKRIFSLPLRLIATCRPGSHTDAQRHELLVSAIGAGTSFVDIETEADPQFREAVIGAAREHRTQVILSYHNYRTTPHRRILRRTVADAFLSGAHIAKIACMVRRPADNLRLLELPGIRTYAGRIVVVGMGQAGRITRVASVFLGSPFTYASCGGDAPLAPGQISAGPLRAAMELIGHE
jgi:3-dehydroquinate dehydratase type I